MQENEPSQPAEPPTPARVTTQATGVKRLLFVAVGLVCVALAIVGALLPGIPTTPWVLLASYCFARSSASLDAWLRRMPYFGTLIRDWELYRGIRRPVKIFAVSMVVIVVSLSITFSNLPIWVKVVIGCWAIIGICTILFVVPTARRPKTLPMVEDCREEQSGTT